jgi:hypothetical protein
METYMAAKEKKTREELTVLLMAEIRKHPDCAHVVGVAITQPVGHGWGAAWRVNGNKLACPQSSEIVTRLQNQFDLA